MPESSDSTYSFLKKVLIFVLIVLSVVLLVMFVGKAINTLLLIFAGILLGVVFRAARDFIHDTTNMNHGLSLALVLLLFVTFTGLIGYLLVPQVVNQADTFYKEVPKTWEMTKEAISGWGWGRELANENPRVQDFFTAKTGSTGEDYDMTERILSYLSFSASVIAAMVLIFVIAIYIAAEPKLYSEGFIRLFPIPRRKRVVQLMDEISITIQWWMVGQLCSMLILGTLATVGLWLLGVPYAIMLGALTAFMTFIPNLGPIIAAVPILLIALTAGVDTAIFTGIFYTVLQCIEGYFITPMIHHRAIDVPPVLIIVIQFLLYYLIGFLGVLLAMPLIGCMAVLVKRLYIQDILGDPLREQTSYDLEGDTIFEDGD